MPADSPPPILVALDDDAGPALRYAVDAAGRAGCALHLLHVVVPGSSPAAHANGERLLHTAAVRARELAAGASRVSTELAHAGPVPDVIVQRASRSRQVVLQRRGGPGHGITERSTCAEVARHAACPVVLVPSPPDDEHPGTREALMGLEVTPALPGALP